VSSLQRRPDVKVQQYDLESKKTRGGMGKCEPCKDRIRYRIICYAVMCDRTIAKKAQISVNDEGVALRLIRPFSVSVDSTEGGIECTAWRSAVTERARW